MQRSKFAAMAFSAVFGVTGASFAQSVNIGSFETGVDGYQSDGGPGSPAVSQGTIGVTQGSFSLKSVNPQGGFWGPSTGNLITSHRADLQGATSVSFDLTLIGTELSGDGSAFGGFAQSNELAVTLFGPGIGPGGSDLNLFIQKGALGNLTDSKSHAGQWAGDDGTRTLTWNLTKFTATDPNDGVTKSVAQFLAQYPGIVDSKICIVEQFNGGNAPGAFYFDNVNLNGVPEPTSLAVLSLGGAAIGLRRRRA